MSRSALCTSVILLAAVAACSDSDETRAVAAPVAPQFAKTPPVTDPTATFSFSTDPTLGVRPDAVSALYAHNVCGVDAKIFATTEYSNSGDAIMQTDNPRFSDRKCAAYPRKVTFVYAAGDAETITTFMNVRNVENTTTVIPINTTVTRVFSVNTTRCGGLYWGNERQGVLVPGDSVLVTRTAANTWHVQTQPAPNDRAYCLNNGQSYHMPVDFTVVTSRDLP